MRALPRPAWNPAANRVLAALPRAERAALVAAMEPGPLAAGDVLYDAGRPIGHLVFPMSGLVSLVCTMESGATAEIAVVGRDGVAGIAAILDAGAAQHRAIVQVAGHAWRLASDQAVESFRRGGALQRALLRYTQALITQVSQTAACNRLHGVERRLCRWLLMTRDRLEGDEILMTQEAIAHMLGVRREGVTAAARRLQAAGLIRYARGHIVLRDRAGLEAAACECYRVIEDEFERLLGLAAPEPVARAEM